MMIELSHEPLINVDSFSIKANEITESSWPNKVLIKVNVEIFHNLIVVSLELLIRILSFEEK